MKPDTKEAEEQQHKRVLEMSKAMQDISDLVDKSYYIIDHFKKLYESKEIDLTVDELANVRSWLHNYMVFSVEMQRKNNSPSVH